MSERERREVLRLDPEQARQYRNLRESNVPHEMALAQTLYCECESPVMDYEHDAGCRRCGRPVNFSPITQTGDETQGPSE